MRRLERVVQRVRSDRSGCQVPPPATTLDTALAGGRVDVLKVDVDGVEAMAVTGGQATLGDPARRPTAILSELFQPNLDPFGASAARG